MLRKVITAALLIAVVLVVLVALQQRDSRLKVYFFDAGQGDAIYIRTPEKYDILIDGGPTDVVLSKLGEAMPFYDRTIDIVILSHPHADHVTGLIGVLKEYRVKQVYFSGAVHTTAEYLEFLTALKQLAETQKIRVDHRFTVTLSPYFRLEFLYPDFDVMDTMGRAEHPFLEDNLNNTSVVVKMIYKDMSWLFTGDIEREVEEYLVSRYGGTILNSQGLKVPHQGSKTSSTLAFLKAVQPSIAVIMAQENNRYGHPHKEVLERFRALGITLLRTDQKGDVVFTYK